MQWLCTISNRLLDTHGIGRHLRLKTGKEAAEVSCVWSDGLRRGGCLPLGLRAGLVERRARQQVAWCWFVGEEEEGGWFLRQLLGAAGLRAVAFCSLCSSPPALALVRAACRLSCLGLHPCHVSLG